MDPLDPARRDDGSVRTRRTGPAGSSAAASPEGPEVPAAAPVLPSRSAPVGRRSPLLVRRTRVGGAAVTLGPDGLSDAWPLAAGPDVAVPGGATWPLPAAGADPQPDDAELAPTALVATVAAGRGRHRRPGTRLRRPALYLAAALLGVAGVAATATGDPSQPARAGEPVSVAEELGMVQAEQPALDADEATARLQQMVASRAEREDAQAAAAQVQAAADRAATEAAAEAARPEVVLPVQGARLTSGFGQRWGTLHAGIDFAAPLGTPEYAAMDGVVLRAGPASGFGLAVYIQHENGDVTVYGHMQKILVEEGQTVRAGDTIALLGNEGQSTGPHLHFEVHVGGIDGERIDPLPWLRDRGVAV